VSNIVLIGPSGAGKTTLGKMLADSLGMAFFDTDKEIEKTANMPISQIFKTFGEGHFRRLEHNICKRFVALKNTVISTGGGTFTNPQNAQFLHADWMVIYLQASPEVILQRLEVDNTRPLLQGDNKLASIQALLQEREQTYKNLATITIDANDTNLDAIKLVAKPKNIKLP